MGWITQGLLDGILGGPPCSTWSRLRFLPDGPRPLRLRWSLWGIKGLTSAEHQRITEANILLVNFLSLAEALSVRGGLCLLEHPSDPEEDPYPSRTSLTSGTPTASKISFCADSGPKTLSNMNRGVP